MGFKKSWDVSDISRQIHSLARECSSMLNDGFTSFEVAKKICTNLNRLSSMQLPKLEFWRIGATVVDRTRTKTYT